MSFLHRMNSSEEGMRNPLSDIRGLMSQAAAIGRDRTATIRSPVLWLALCGGLIGPAICIRTDILVGEILHTPPHNREHALPKTLPLPTRPIDQHFSDS